MPPHLDVVPEILSCASILILQVVLQKQSSALSHLLKHRQPWCNLVTREPATFIKHYEATGAVQR